jgi:hypothetical protein
MTSVVTSGLMDWRELHLNRRSRAFNAAHRWVKVAAIAVGFPATTLSLMALAGRYSESLNVRAAIAVGIALAVPAIVARIALPKEDPLVAVGLPSEMYALFLLGFAVVFVIALHEYSAPILIREGDRQSCAGFGDVARATWALGGAKRPSGSRTIATPCGGVATR